MKGVLIGAALVLVSHAAQADWGYTKWGMSPSEVVTASKSVARETTPEERMKYYLSPLIIAKLTAPVIVGSFKFSAIFYFNMTTEAMTKEKLFKVSLFLDGKDLIPDLSLAMTRKYGEAIEYHSSQHTITKEWLTSTDHIEFSITLSQQNATSATIKYTQRFGDDNSSL